MPATENFNWLHLTDLHYGQSGQRPLWPNIREAFFTDLKELHERCGPWHAVLFTGDFVQTGTAEEFSRMQKDVLSPLLSTLRRLGSDPVLLAVPGNHDLERPDLTKRDPALKWLLHPGLFAEIADEFWADPDCPYRRVVAGTFAAYQNWWRDVRPKRSLQEGGLPGDFAYSLELKSRKVGIIGLNTTFLQLKAGEFEGHLAWDVSQIHAACAGDAAAWIAEHDACLLLTHQGRDWLDPRAQEAYAEINPAGRFAVHHFGHMHKTVYRNFSSGGGKATRHFQGNSLFSVERIEAPHAVERRHGYAAGRIAFQKGRATLRFWPRRALYDDNGWRFVPDHEGCVLRRDETKPEILEPSQKLWSPRGVGATRSRVHSAEVTREEPPSSHFEEDEESGFPDGEAMGGQGVDARRLVRQFVRLFSKDVERVVRQEVRQFVDLYSKNAFESVLERIVPEPIFVEIQEILRTEVLRRDCEYVITLAQPYETMPPGYFIVRRELSFEVENLLNRSTTFVVRSSYMGGEELGSMSWWRRPFHLELKVNGVAVSISDKNLSRQDGTTVLQEEVPLPPRGKAQIFLKGEEPCRVDTGWNAYIQRTPAAGIQVDIRNEYAEAIEALGVQMHHPAAKDMMQPLSWRFVLARAFLPGQGFLVLWRRREGLQGGSGSEGNQKKRRRAKALPV